MEGCVMLGIFVVVICVVLYPLANSANAITAEVAKKCAALTDKAFPPRVVGNPAAGSAKGNGQAEKLYFNKCVSNGGAVDESAPADGKPAPKEPSGDGVRARPQ
jgi:hypothetical protein